jgi:hypothetical protein
MSRPDLMRTNDILINSHTRWKAAQLLRIHIVCEQLAPLSNVDRRLWMGFSKGIYLA